MGNNTQIEHFDNRAIEYYTARSNYKNRYYRTLLHKYCLAGIDFPLDRPISVIEPMCGYGTGYDILRRTFPGVQFDYEGFDSSGKMIRYAKSIHGNLKLFEADALKWSPERKYDVAIIMGGVHHVAKDATILINRIHDCLKDGGYFINFEPTYNNKIVNCVSKEIYRRKEQFDEKSERRFSLQEINEIYKETGFKMLKQTYPGLLAYLLWNNPQIFANLNLGNKRLIHDFFCIESHLYNTFFAKSFSVATYSIMVKS